MIWFGWLLFFFWLANSFILISFVSKRRLELCAGKILERDALPSLSIIVPACNEEIEIENALLSLLELDYPDLEIVVVNDRSTDGTGDIIRRLARGNDHLTEIHIETLPPGWLGKNHAMHRAAEIAKGDFLLFTDGDIIFAKDTLKLALSYSVSNGLDHLCLVPSGPFRTALEGAFKSFFLFSFLIFVQAFRIRSTSKNVYVGAGAFNLVRHEAYKAVGGHESFKLEVIDDITLGKIIKQAGFKQDFLMALPFLNVRWHDGILNLIIGLEKNMFAALEFSLARAILLSAVTAVLYFSPYYGVVVYSGAKVWGFWFALLMMHGLFGYFSHKINLKWTATFFLPAVVLLILATIFNSTWTTLRQGGVRWRDTFYSLDELSQAKRELDNLFIELRNR